MKNVGEEDLSLDDLEELHNFFTHMADFLEKNNDSSVAHRYRMEDERIEMYYRNRTGGKWVD